ncbi:WD repeat-containing protein 82 [Neolecta irregularis DAH-3]|uniref:WD repeat-containing protein 82 n=1 Tax=Neolecta irregularis (strain DAH-3) TaxID=1198029 RepID=A0A1U7LKY3_NEOID|nr:WD repeat-containing protein 82 [Neolecta irregularis DAH-3]|eukprot:OLL23299.1 WD repeat-containing protein 82 [Neolecta irregularis DAH-3]
MEGLLNIPGPNLGAFDPSGIIFAVLSQSLNTLLLYDLRNFDKEPFSEFSLSDDSFLQKFSFPARMPEFQRLEFTNDGKHIFVGTTGKVHYSIHSFEGNIVSRMIGHEPVETAELNAGNSCVTPDGRYALAASNDRQIMVWDLHRKTPEVRESKSISTKSVGICDLVAFNHKSALMVTTSKEALTFWLPDASVS